MKAPTFQTLDALETSPDSLAWANVCRAEGDTGICDQIMTWYIILDSMEDVSLGKESANSWTNEANAIWHIQNKKIAALKMWKS